VPSGAVAKDLAGKVFGSLTVLHKVEDSRKNARWLVRCACGKELVIAGYTLKSRKNLSCGCVKSTDLTGKVFGDLTVAIKLAPDKFGRTTYQVRCACGREQIMASSHLKSRKNNHCGCKLDIDLTDKTFGKLKVLSLHVERTLSGLPKNRKWKCICECGTEKLIATNRLTSGDVTSCGCSMYKKGPDNGRYNPNKTDEERSADRTYEEYIEWRKLIFERDAYTCVCCGYDKGGTLNAHHIMSYTAFEDYRTIDINGITLCKPCHIEFHGLYGYGGNTLSQLLEWQQIKGFKL